MGLAGAISGITEVFDAIGGGGVTTLNGESGAVTLTSSGGSITITTPTADTINLESVSGGSGTVTSVSVVNTNGFDGTVATATSTPAITIKTTITGIIKGNGTAISAATSGTDYSLGTSALATGILKSTTATGALTIAVAGDFPTLNQNTTGNATTATTASNLATANETSDSTCFPVFVTASGTQASIPPKTNSTFGYDSTNNTLSVTNFSGALAGNATTATALANGRTISITGDLAYTSPSFDGSGNVTAAGTLATVNGNVGSFGSSTSIPSLTVNAKGLITAASGNAVIAPAGTLTGTTLAAAVVTSSLTSVGTLATGTWNATVITGQYGGTGVANTGKTITLGGNLITSGAFATTLTATNTTSITLPTTGTLATLSGSEALTNKSVNGVTLVNGGTSTLYLSQDGTYTTPTVSSVAFSAITSGTNTAAAMVVGTGGTLGVSGSGTIAATTAVVLANARTIGGVSFNGSADIVPQTIQSVNEATDTTCFPLFISASGSQSLQPLNNANLKYNSNTGALDSTSFLANGVSVPSVSSTDTLTNKRITQRVTALSANSATPTINTDNCDVVHITAQTAAITSFTTNLSGTPVDGDKLRISITGTASVALTWGASFEASTVALPTTTSSTTRLDVGFFWNTETSKWRCVAVA